MNLLYHFKPVRDSFFSKSHIFAEHPVLFNIIKVNGTIKCTIKLPQKCLMTNGTGFDLRATKRWKIISQEQLKFHRAIARLQKICNRAHESYGLFNNNCMVLFPIYFLLHGKGQPGHSP